MNKAIVLVLSLVFSLGMLAGCGGGKDKTDAIPLYTNFAAGWTITAWDAYISGGATADGGWMNITMPLPGKMPGTRR